LLLVDHRGRILGGRVEVDGAGDVSDAVAAYLAGATQEAERTVRMLDLGDWEWIVSEGPGGNIYVTPPTDETLLFILRDRSVPAGRLALLAERAGAAARQWLTSQRL
jgi:predicted regulator of Ras-like GTPase activity (Roadblock/LC7/MglB family)